MCGVEGWPSCCACWEMEWWGGRSETPPNVCHRSQRTDTLTSCACWQASGGLWATEGVRPAGGTPRIPTSESRRRLVLVLTRVADSARAKRPRGDVWRWCGITSVVSALALGHAQSRPAAWTGHALTRLHADVVACFPPGSTRPVGWRVQSVWWEWGAAVDARSGGGGASPSAAQRPPRVFKSLLLDSSKNKSHK